MGIYYNKLVESAVEGGIQNPNDIGVDLKHVENVIAGNDGIEAHKEEIDAAVDGMIGDPMDEAMIIMYESEYNMNQIMQCIGIAEIAEYAEGNNFVLEGKNFAAWKENIKTALETWFKKFKNWFNDVIDTIEKSIDTNKLLLKTNRKKIESGFHKANWNIDHTYDLDLLDVRYDPNLSSHNMINDFDENNPPTEAECIENITGIKVSSDNNAIEEMTEKLTSKHVVNKKYTAADEAVLKNVIDILGGGKIEVDFKKIYRSIEDDYNLMIKTIEKLHTDPDTDIDARLEHVKMFQYELNVHHAYFAFCVKMQKMRCSQARKMALVWIKADKGAAETSLAVTNTNESFVIPAVSLI